MTDRPGDDATTVQGEGKSFTDPGAASQRAAAAEAPDELPRPVGRYTLLECVGSGGMGRVYRARDPELSRTVAVKVLHIGGRRLENVRQRLRREAQAMARLNHPNVVPVYDVESDDDALYIVMEFVEGKTLAQWLVAGPSWTESVDVMLQAGEGLAAAHSAELVHRDFKPANVMLREDGRVLVMDFGLARALGAESVPEPEDVIRSTVSSEDPFASPITRIGEAVGTPAYMSPQQSRGHGLGPPTDQYAFCITLYEALYGTRPFLTKTRRGLLKAKEVGLSGDPPDVGVPRAVHRAVVRGLSPIPGQRWPDMNALLAELRAARRPKSRKMVLAAGAGIAAAAIGSAWIAHARDFDAHCSSEHGLHGIWDEAAQDRTHSALTATGMANADELWNRLEGRLDRYAGSWRTAYDAACAEGGDETAIELRDHEMACLTGARSELGALLEVMAQEQDPVAMSSAAESAWQLTPISHCTALLAVGPQQASRGAAADFRRARELRARLDRASALVRAQEPARALDALERLLPDTRTTDDPALIARTQLATGRVLADLGRFEDARQQLEEAYETSLDASMFEVSAEAATTLVDVVGSKLDRFDEAEAWADHASSWLSRAQPPPVLETANLLAERSKLAAARGDFDGSESLAEQALETAGLQYVDDPLLIRFHSALGNAYLRRGRYPKARDEHERALTMAREAYGPGHLSMATHLNNLAAVYFQEGDFTTAADYFAKSHETKRGVMGDDDPRLGGALNNLGTALAEAGHFDEAEPHLRRAIEMFEIQYGASHPKMGTAWTNLGSALHSAGRLKEARTAHTRAVELLRDGLGPDHPETADALGNLAAVERVLGNTDAALRLHEQALDIRLRTLGKSHTAVAVSFNNLGILASETGKVAHAESLHRQALEIYTEAVGPDSNGAGDSLTQLARISLDRGDVATARDLSERALRIKLRSPDEPAKIGRVRFLLAKALLAVGDEGERPLTLARRALDDYARAGPSHEEPIREIESWLAQSRQP